MLQMSLFAKPICRNRDTDIENKCMDINTGKRNGINWEIGIDIYTSLGIKQITNENILFSTGSSIQ